MQKPDLEKLNYERRKISVILNHFRFRCKQTARPPPKSYIQILIIYFNYLFCPERRLWLPPTHQLNTTQSLKADLYTKITGFDDLKLVMETIGQIQSTTISIEIQLHEMQEAYSVLEDHKIQVCFAHL